MLSAPLRHPSSPRASDLLRHRFREPWSLARLATATDLSTRTLNRVTRRQSGLSPMALLRQARLAQARLELDAPGPAATVTIVALDCGFTHLGRFSLDYARQFGESPSETLRRARRRLPAA